MVVATSSAAIAQPISAWDRRQAWVTVGARASLSSAGPWLASSSKAEWSIEVHDDTGARGQFVEHANGVDVVLYADRAALLPVALPGAVLYPSVGASQRPFDDRSPGVRLKPGTVIAKMTPVASGLVRVHVTMRGDLEVSGFVRASAVGAVCVVEADESSPITFDVWLREGFNLRETPGGQVFARSKRRGDVDALTLQRDKAWTLVRLPEGAVGWIASNQATATAPLTMYDPSRFLGIGDGEARAQQETLPAGTPVYDAPGGSVVGVVVKGFRDHPVKRAGDWLEFNVATIFGAVSLWAPAVAGAPDLEVRNVTARINGSASPCVGTGCGTRPRPVEIGFGVPSGDLGGFRPEEIERSVKARAGVFRACYEKELNYAPGIAGTLIVEFMIRGDGTVQPGHTMTSSGSTLRNDAVEQCVKANVNRLKFLAKGTIANVKLPFVFTQAP